MSPVLRGTWCGRRCSEGIAGQSWERVAVAIRVAASSLFSMFILETDKDIKGPDQTVSRAGEWTWLLCGIDDQVRLVTQPMRFARGANVVCTTDGAGGRNAGSQGRLPADTAQPWPRAFSALGASNVSSNPNWHPDHKFNCGPTKTETNGFMIQTTARRYSINVVYQGSESDMTAHTVCLRIHSRPFLFIGSQGH